MKIRRGLSRILLKRRMYHVRVTFLLRSRGVSVTNLYSYGISLSYVQRIKAYVLRTSDVCMAYEVYALRIYGVCTTLYSYLRRICSIPIAFNTSENKWLCSLCSWNSHIAVINYHRSKMPPVKSGLLPKKNPDVVCV